MEGFFSLSRFLESCGGYYIFYKIIKDEPIRNFPKRIEDEIKDVAFKEQNNFFVKKSPERLYPTKGKISRVIDFLLISKNESKNKALKEWYKEIKKAKTRREKYLNFLKSKIKPSIEPLFKSKLFDMLALRYSSLTDGLPLPNDDIDLIVFQDKIGQSKDFELKIFDKLGRWFNWVSFHYLRSTKKQTYEETRIYYTNKGDFVTSQLDIHIIDPKIEFPLRKKSKTIGTYRYIYNRCLPLFGIKEYEKWRIKLGE